MSKLQPNERVEQEFIIAHPLGLHARPAAEFVRCAQLFRSRVEIVIQDRRFSAQRLLEVLLAGLQAGSRFLIVAEGPDAKAAVETLGTLLRRQAEDEAKQVLQPDYFRWR